MNSDQNDEQRNDNEQVQQVNEPNNEEEKVTEQVIIHQENESLQQNNNEQGQEAIQMENLQKKAEVIQEQGQIVEQQKQIPVEFKKKSSNLQQYLVEQIERYTKIEVQCDVEKDKQILQKIIATMQQQLDNLKLTNQGIQNQTNDISNFGGISLIQEMERSHNVEGRIRRNLLQIYQGPSDDFNRINHESHTLTEGKFLIFCRQFNILDEKVHHQVRNTNVSLMQNSIDDSVHTHKWWLQNKYLQKQNQVEQPLNWKQLSFKEINQIYRKHNDQQNEISFNKFETLLPLIAKEMFFQQEQSLNLFYDLIEIKSNGFKEKMKSLSIPFNSKDPNGYRRPEGLITIKGKHSSKSQELKKQQVKQWRQEKQEQMRERLISDQQINKSQSKVYKPSNELYTLNRNSNNYQEQKQQKLNYLSKQYNQLNWEKLEKLQPSFIQVDFDPNDLIDEQEDEDDRYYLKSFDVPYEPQSRKPTQQQQQQQQLQQQQQYQIQSTKRNRDSTNDSTRQQTKVTRNKTTNQGQKLLQPVRSAYIKLPKLQ